VTGSLPAYLARRFALLLVTLVAVPSICFLVFAWIQGDATSIGDLLGDLLQYMNATFLQGGLDEGTKHSSGFVGEVYNRTRTALTVVKEGFFVDVYLLVGAIGSALVLGILGGAIQAMYPRSYVSRAIFAVTAVLLSTPAYWLGLVALLLFGPVIGSVLPIPFLSTPGSFRPFDMDPVRFIHSTWMPCLIIGAPLLAGVTRMTASGLRSSLSEEFVRTARGKGVRRWRVTGFHALPVVAPTVVALVGVNMNLVLTNLALVEIVFNIPGGYRFIEPALINRDTDLIQALVLESTLFIVVANFLSDAVQGWLDPRVRTGEPF
jgi:peptide/nickel transport system permease protein